MADLPAVESRETVITGATGLTDLVINPDGSINVTGSSTVPVTVIQSDTSAARAGKLYLVNSTFLSVATPTETDFFLLKNPIGSGKTVTLERLVFTSDENISATYRVRIYLNPTITTNGTSRTVINARQIGTTVASSTAFSSPTISARGTLVYVTNFVLGLGGIEPGTLLLDPNNNYLITLQTDNTANFNMCMSFSELSGI